MKKRSRLALADRLTVELTLLVSREIAKRLRLIKKTATQKEKKSRCGCMHCFGEALVNLRNLEKVVHKLRVERKFDASLELKEALQNCIRYGQWHWARDYIGVEKRVQEILDD